MFTISAVESIRFTQTVDRSWVERLLAAAHPRRAGEFATLSNPGLAAELAAVAADHPSILAALEALLADGAEFSRFRDFTLGAVLRDGTAAGGEFAVHGGPGITVPNAATA